MSLAARAEIAAAGGVDVALARDGADIGVRAAADADVDILRRAAARQILKIRIDLASSFIS